MPETPGLYLKLSLRENLEFFAGLYGLPSAGVAARIGEVLAAVGLADRADELAGSLSKGLRQRAALARALLPDPSVVFLDEPTSGLDPAAAVEVRGLIESLRTRGHTVFLTTHRLEEAERLCDRVAILRTRVLAIGPPDELRRRFFGLALEVRLGAPLTNPAVLFEPIKNVAGWSAGGVPGSYLLQVSSRDGAAPEVARAVVSAGADLLHLAEVEHSLEDVYLQLTEAPS